MKTTYESIGNTIQERFLWVVDSLKLSFPVAEITEKTGYSKGQVSKYLQPNQKASKEFIKKFCEVFNVEFDVIWFIKPSIPSNKNEVNEDKVSYQTQSAYIKSLEDQIHFLKDQLTKAQTQFNLSQDMLNKMINEVSTKLTSTIDKIVLLRHSA